MDQHKHRTARNLGQGGAAGSRAGGTWDQCDPRAARVYVRQEKAADSGA